MNRRTFFRRAGAVAPALAVAVVLGTTKETEEQSYEGWIKVETMIKAVDGSRLRVLPQVTLTGHGSIAVDYVAVSGPRESFL